ncbi:hypothetical protein M513_10694 [Trichuris suis]|uniref:DDE-1 domain-containing protein n=1 Tax=Trichuris suis TaxID=68888 RepID=A0A085LU30_9BILA|nr:hypothetical protein M513_10694 [Trichuris suis]
MAAKSWESVKQITLRNAWNKIFVGRVSSVDITLITTQTKKWKKLWAPCMPLLYAMNVTSLTSIGDGFEFCFITFLIAFVDRWLASDSEDQGFQIMNDEEIIEFISKQPADTEEEDKQGDEKESQQTAFPSQSEAFGYLEGALRWYERQDECDPRRFVSEKHSRPRSCETLNCFEANTDDRFSAKSLTLCCIHASTYLEYGFVTAPHDHLLPLCLTCKATFSNENTKPCKMKKHLISIIEALKRGESGRSLSEKYAVGAAMVSAIKKRGDVIQDYSKSETGLNWKTLPTKSLITSWEECAPGCKRRKGRVTLLCANSSGTHRLPLFLVGKSKNPRSFKNVKLPVRYSHQKQAWMNLHVFKEWFKGTVKRYQSSVGKTGKVLLLIDNAPAHPPARYLDAVDEFVTIKLLPPNVTFNSTDGSRSDRKFQTELPKATSSTASLA